MATIISTVSLNGGVGKTSMTIALAEFLATENGKKVLLIDLDPQANATTTMMDQQIWLKKDKIGETLLQIFKDNLDKTLIFNIKKAIVKNASNVGGGIRNLDLLPSSLGLIEIQDTFPLISTGRYYITSPFTILREAISDILDGYDFVLLDHPPNWGIIALNGIFISDYYLIPIIPNMLSTYGVPQLLGKIDSFKKVTKINISPLGIVISMYQAESKLHNTVTSDLRSRASSGSIPRIFETIMPLIARSPALASAGFEVKVDTLKQKYRYGKSFDIYKELTKEISKYI